jgi:hypothetical protein
LVTFLVAVGITAGVVWLQQEPAAVRAETDAPLGVEEAVIIRYRGPRLVAQPYRRGASVNVRIADMVETQGTRIYDVRYVVNLPGEFDLTDYLTSADGQPIDDLPGFTVRGLTSLTKDIETRIQEIEDVGVHIGHWYYETLVLLAVLWIAWLIAMIIFNRRRRPTREPPPPPPPSIAERIERHLVTLREQGLSVEELAELETLLLSHWRGRLQLAERRMAAACRRIDSHEEVGDVYRKLIDWLHNPHAEVDAHGFLQTYESRRSAG